MYTAVTLLVYFILTVSLAAALPMPHRCLNRRTCDHNAWSADIQTPSSTLQTSVAAAPTQSDHPPPPPPPAHALSPAHTIQSWSTSPLAPNALALADSTFRPTNMLFDLAPTYVKAPDGKLSMRAHYPQGSYTLTRQPLGGLSFYAPGPSQVDLSTAKEATFGYSILFPEGFEFNIGGKLPGLYGGNSDAAAIDCSGGRHSSNCFSARLMWRQGGQGELYTYLPPNFSANNVLCDVKPSSTCNPEYGDSVGRGAFQFTAGQRATVSQRVRLNDAGQANGEVQLFMNGQSVINVNGLVFRDSDAGRIRGIQMQTFFGGHSADYASPRSQDAYFSDFSVAITEQL